MRRRQWAPSDWFSVGDPGGIAPGAVNDTIGTMAPGDVPPALYVTGDNLWIGVS
jgi:hypothetical protein